MQRTKIILQIILALLLVFATVTFVIDKSVADSTGQLDSTIKFQKMKRPDKPNWKHPLGDVHFLPAQFSNHLFQLKKHNFTILLSWKKNSLHNTNAHS